MKTTLKEISSFKALYEAHRRARKGKRGKKEIINYEINLASNLWKAKQKLDSGSYRCGKYHEFTIYEPKQRLIQAMDYGDRVVQHSICDNALTPYVKAHVVTDNAACQKGKGTHYALKRLTKHLTEYYRQHGTKGWLLKADIRKYFASIDHKVLKAQIRNTKLSGEIKTLLETVIDGYNKDTGKGLPMGNQSSQQFAVLYLDPVDRLAKERYRIKHYSRYMDDIIALHENRQHLEKLLEEMRSLVQDKLKLELNEKTMITPLKCGIDYLGWHYWLTETGKVIKKLRTASKKRIYKRIKQLAHQLKNGTATEEDKRNTVASYKGHLKHGNARGVYEKIEKILQTTEI